MKYGKNISQDILISLFMQEPFGCRVQLARTHAEITLL